MNVLPQNLDFSASADLKAFILSVRPSGKITLDAAAVERMSTPCAQVILAAGRSAEAAGIPFRIANPSEIFRTAIAELGLQADLARWMI